MKKINYYLVLKESVSLLTLLVRLMTEIVWLLIVYETFKNLTQYYIDVGAQHVNQILER